MKIPFPAHALASAMLLSLAACGGGGDSAGDLGAQAPEVETAGLSNEDVLGVSAQAGRAQALAVGSPAVGTLQAASTNAAGKLRGGSVCAISADGSLVLFVSDSSTIVVGDTNGAADLFLKNLRSGAVTRVNTTATGAQMFGGAGCLGMTPDGRSVAFSGLVSTPGAIFPAGTSETVIFVKNVATGALTRATPPLTTFPNTASYTYSGLADDGSRVAFVAQPTTTYLGGYLTAFNGPARMLVANLPSGALINLESSVRWRVNGGTDAQFGEGLLSPDGRKLAFTTSVDYPEIGDTNARDDVFTVDLATLQVRLVSTDSAGVQAQVQPATYRPQYSLMSFLSGGGRLAFDQPAVSSFGAPGVYVKNLASGALNLAFARGEAFNVFGPFSFSDDGSKIAYIDHVGRDPQAFVRTLATGQTQRLDVTASGVTGNGLSNVALLSRDGTSAAFASSATNLVGGTSKLFRLESYVKTIAAGPAVAQ